MKNDFRPILLHNSEIFLVINSLQIYPIKMKIMIIIARTILNIHWVWQTMLKGLELFLKTDKLANIFFTR